MKDKALGRASEGQQALGEGEELEASGNGASDGFILTPHPAAASH